MIFLILQLRILNFAIIEELHIEFHEGFNVLTGETGAGKSILLDALGLLLGERGSTDFIRYGQAKAEIEGFFSFVKHSQVHERLLELGIDCEDDTIIIRRDLTLQGKSTCRINGQLVTISMLKQVGEALINFHSQHDHHQLLQSHRHIHWLDSFAGKVLESELLKYKQLYHRFMHMKNDYEQLTRNEQERAQRIDLLKYQINEIEQSDLKVGEEEHLLEDKNRLIHAEKIITNVQGAYSALLDEQKALDWLGASMSHLGEVSNLDEELRATFQQIEETFYLLDDLARELGKYTDKNDFDPNKLDAIEDRLDHIHRLKRKYGDSVDSILEYLTNTRQELDRLENSDSIANQLMDQLIELKAQIIQSANNLTRLRTDAARTFEKAVKLELSELHLEKAIFVVQISDLSMEVSEISLDLAGNDKGMNEIEFLITTNPGEPLKPLSKVASGGELSRLAVALRTVLARIDQVETLVFDEVDTGVSGRITHAIGEKLLRIATDRQVLAITHHPQVASLADIHFLIEKEVEGDRTKTRLKKLNEEERIHELARMIGGDTVSSSAKAHASEIRKYGKEIKMGK